MDNQTINPPEPQQPTGEVSTSTVPPTENPKSYGRNWKKWILIGGIVPVVLLTGSAYILSQQKNQKPETKTVTLPTISQLSPTPDPTADWKTYTNTKYEYSIKHPENTKIDSKFDESITFSRNITPKPGNGGQGICCGMTINFRPYGYIVNPDMAKNTKINGYIAKVFNYGGPYHYSYLVDNPIKTITMEISIITASAIEPYDKEDFEIFNQMLSTFKFTESQTSKKRQFDPTSLFFDKQKYPAEIINVPDNDLVGMTCSEYDEYGDNKNAEIAKYKKIVQQNYSEKKITGFQYCKTDDQKTIVSYGLGPCGGGCSGEPHMGLIINDDFQDIATIQGKSAYFGCRKPLQLTTENILYYECGGGDGGAGSSSINKIDLKLKTASVLAKCSSYTNTSNPEPWETTISCN